MGINLVVFPFHDWKKCEREGFRTRDAHFMQEFEKHPGISKMLVINRPISIPEIILLGRNLRPENGKVVWKKGLTFLTQVSQKVYVLDILVPEFVKPLIMRRNWTSYIFGKNSVHNSINLATDFLKIKNDFSIFISAPLFVPAVKFLSPKAFIFDAQDNLLKHAMYKSTRNLSDYYDYCLKEANLIYSNSKETENWFHNFRPDALQIANGVDTKTFNYESAYTIPEDMANLSKPIVGYAGKMQELFDIDLVEKCVHTFPHVNFVFIGQELDPKWTKKLWGYPNTFYLGDKKYKFLPQYLSNFDVCIVPLNKARQHGGDPIKLYEYLAMGKPVVTTNVEGAEIFKDFPQIRISRTDEEFLEGLRYFINKIKKQEMITRTDLPNFCTWEYKANKVVNDILLLMR